MAGNQQLDVSATIKVRLRVRYKLWGAKVSQKPETGRYCLSPLHLLHAYLH